MGVPQGSPLSSLLYRTYVADVVAPWLHYRLSVRAMISSYADDVTITVAADLRDMACAAVIELFVDCLIVVAARGLGVSVPKTQWIGISGVTWNPIEIMGIQPAPLANIRILWYFINRYLNWSDHV